MDCYVLLITDGTVIEYPPEIYGDAARGRLEAERWAWVLSGGGWQEVSQPFPGRWQVAGRDVRLIEATAPHLTDELWVGTYWTEDGYPEPEAALLTGRQSARRWVLDDPRGQQPADFSEQPWWFAAIYRRLNGDEAYAVAWLGKVVKADLGYPSGRSDEEPKTTT